MAENINLPDLISHLGVDLTGLNGTIADATRQGSSIGAALGGGVQRNLRDLVANLPTIDIDADSDEIDQDLARVRRELEELGNQRIGVDISVEQALRRINELSPHLARLSDEHPDITVQATTRQAAAQLDEILAAARRVDDTTVRVDVDVDEDRVTRANRLTGILGRLGGMAGPLAGVGASVGKITAGIGSAVPVAGALATTLANIVPAAGVAVTGLAAVQLASGAVKLAAVGMKDALSSALDPSKSKDFAKSLEHLAPAAREFATTVHGMAPALREVQQSVQQEVFRGLADTLERTSKSVLPTLRTNLLSSATALHDMAAGALGAARGLGESGTLGKALGSASKGLRNLAGVPGLVVTGLGQIAAAAGPSFERLTSGAAKAASGIGDRLSKAFESGAIQKAIEHAIALIKQLMQVGGNVASIIGSVFNAVPSDGGGMVTVLRDITGEIAKIAKTAEVQSALRALFQTMGTLGATVAPLLGQALSAIGPVLTALGPPVQTLIKALGAGIQPIIAALGPVLEQAAGAIGALVVAASPLLPVIGQLAAALLPALTPLLAGLQRVFEALAPVVAQVASVASATLAPILAQLPALIEPLVQIVADRLVFSLQAFGLLLVKLAPSLISLGESAGVLLAALAPLIQVVADLSAQVISGLTPALAPLVGIIGAVAQVLAAGLAATINGIVVPSVRVVAALLKGDWSGAWTIARNAVANANAIISQKVTEMAAAVGAGVTTGVNWLRGMGGRSTAALSNLGSALAGTARSAGSQMVSAISSKIGEAVSSVRSLPSRALGALGGLSGLLYNSGASLIGGFIAGIRSKIGAVADAVSSVVSKARDFFPFSPAKVGPFSGRGWTLYSGQALIKGLEKGITDRLPNLRAALSQIPALPALAVPQTDVAVGSFRAPSSRDLTAAYAHTGGDQYVTFHQYGSEATPDGMLRALSWHGLVGGG